MRKTPGDEYAVVDFERGEEGGATGCCEGGNDERGTGVGYEIGEDPGMRREEGAQFIAGVVRSVVHREMGNSLTECVCESEDIVRCALIRPVIPVDDFEPLERGCLRRETGGHAREGIDADDEPSETGGDDGVVYAREQSGDVGAAAVFGRDEDEATDGRSWSGDGRVRDTPPAFDGAVEEDEVVEVWESGELGDEEVGEDDPFDVEVCEAGHAGDHVGHDRGWWLRSVLWLDLGWGGECWEG